MGDPAKFSDLETIFGNVVRVAIAAAGVVLFIMLIVGGINLLTAGSEAPKAEAAKKTITYAIYGMVFIALSFLILRLIATFTGVEGLLEFKVTQ